MIRKLTFLFLFSVLVSGAQEKNSKGFSITPELLFGITGEPNTGFPDRGVQKQVFVSFGWQHTKHSDVWASYLKNVKTGLSIGVADLGNASLLGTIFTLQPFIEFKSFRSEDFTTYVGFGSSYVKKKHDPITNEFNRAVSTNLNWSFRLFMYYSLLKSESINWRVGLGYNHNSNGHAKLPNQGYNSFLLSLGGEINTSKTPDKNTTPAKIPTKTVSNYIAFRSGYGQNVLSEAFGTKKSVYTLSGTYGRLYNSVLKIGIGAYVRFYQTYYDYISNNESLVQNGREFSDLSSNAFINALNVGITVSGELLLNHIGIELQGGVNIFKPAYKIDWRINKGWGDVPKVIPESGGNFRLGDINEDYYKIKRTISARLGLKYYLINTVKSPTRNFYIGGFINSNLGQADFSEVAIGYVKTFTFKDNKLNR